MIRAILRFLYGAAELRRTNAHDSPDDAISLDLPRGSVVGGDGLEPTTSSV
jgi:hypothetical protein